MSIGCHRIANSGSDLAIFGIAYFFVMERYITCWGSMEVQDHMINPVWLCNWSATSQLPDSVGGGFGRPPRIWLKIGGWVQTAWEMPFRKFQGLGPSGSSGNCVLLGDFWVSRLLQPTWLAVTKILIIRLFWMFPDWDENWRVGADSREDAIPESSGSRTLYLLRYSWFVAGASISTKY